MTKLRTGRPDRSQAGERRGVRLDRIPLLHRLRATEMGAQVISIDATGASAGDVVTYDGSEAVLAPPVPTTPIFEESVEFVVEGASVAAAQTTLALAFGDGTPLDSAADLGAPLSSEMTAATVAVSWMCDSTPAGDWTLTLWRRTVGGSMSAVATFDLATS